MGLGVWGSIVVCAMHGKFAIACSDPSSGDPSSVASPSRYEGSDFPAFLLFASLFRALENDLV